MSGKEKLFALVVMVLGVLGFNASKERFEAEYATYQSQNKCIAKLVSAGIERADIVRIGNSCEIKTNQK